MRVARDLVSLTKPRVNLLVVLTALGGLHLAPATIPWSRAFPFLIATAAIVGSANALNCWWERDSDRHMARTKNRPLPSGRLSPRIALAFGVGLGALSVPALAWSANALTALLGAIALVTYVGIYTPMKRRSPLALHVGAIPGAMPPLMGWTAATGSIDAGGLALFGILFLWQLPHFLAIALYRRREYARAGLRALPVVAGERVAKVHAAAFAVMLGAASLLPTGLGLAGLPYALVAGLLGAAFVALSLRGFWTRVTGRWARRLFLASLVHLTVLVGALMIDRVWMATT